MRGRRGGDGNHSFHSDHIGACDKQEMKTTCVEVAYHYTIFLGCEICDQHRNPNKDNFVGQLTNCVGGCDCRRVVCVLPNC